LSALLKGILLLSMSDLKCMQNSPLKREPLNFKKKVLLDIFQSGT